MAESFMMLHTSGFGWQTPHDVYLNYSSVHAA